MNIRCGIEQHAAEGTSKLYNKPCYGYRQNEEGTLVIDKNEAATIQLIFRLYLVGDTSIGIIRELERKDIESPKGKDKWCKQTIDFILGNEKYTGNVTLLKNTTRKKYYLGSGNNPPIISAEIFEKVQQEKKCRSNVESGDIGNKRRSKKYSSKQKNGNSLI